MRLSGALFSTALTLTLVAAEVTEIGDRAYHVVLSGTDRQTTIPNPDNLAIFFTNAKGNVCWDPNMIPAYGCVGPGGSGIVPARDIRYQPEDFIDPGRPAGTLVYKTESGVTRIAVNDRDNDGAFSDNSGQFEFDVFLAEREPLEQADLEWIRSSLVAIDTPEARNGFADLQKLRDLVGKARIVSLGEATHGTREFFQLKHRILEYLATEMGFSIFSIEANMPEAYRLNDYVLNGIGDPQALIRGMHFWTWQTEEVLDMVRWMREFNESGRGRVQFTGFDMQYPDVAAQAVRDFAAAAHPDLVPELEAVHGDAIKLSGVSPAAFGLAVGTFPLSAAAGKRVRYSGYIKSDRITRGYAGLWWRVDGRGGVMFLDNMSSRGPRGTTDWRRYEIVLTVGADATSIAFGVLHPGNGTAWFDNLSVEVDGQVFSDSRFDFDFESPALRGFSTSGAGYTVSLDDTIAQRGSRSLRSRMNILPDDELISRSAAIVSRMEESREAYRSQGMSDDAIEWAIQNARIVWQFTSSVSSPGLRDRFMAENIKWIADRNPGARMVLWAHNGHVAASGYPFETMGSFLRRDFGDEMAVFGFAFNQGAFQAIDAVASSLREHAVAPAPHGSIEGKLAETGVPLFALDLRAAPRVGPGSLLRQTLPTRSIGALYDTRYPDAYFTSLDSASANDVILFVNTTTRARSMR